MRHLRSEKDKVKTENVSFGSLSIECYEPLESNNKNIKTQHSLDSIGSSNDR